MPRTTLVHRRPCYQFGKLAARLHYLFPDFFSDNYFLQLGFLGGL